MMKTGRYLPALFLISAALLFASCGSGDTTPSDSENPQVAFFEALKAECGSTYTGSTEFASSNDPNDPFVVNPLKIHIRDCEADVVRIPFYVGADSSRTWILTMTEAGLELKHQHLMPDGSPDSITNYGGTSDGTGTGLAQHFPADAFTANLNTDYTTNKWSLIMDPENGVFEYVLERHSQPRYHARLQKDRN